MATRPVQRDAAAATSALRELATISVASPDDLPRALKRILCCAVMLCRSDVGSIHVYEAGGQHRRVAVCGTRLDGNDPNVDLDALVVEALITRLRAEGALIELSGSSTDANDASKAEAPVEHGAFLGVPIERGGRVAGAILVGRTEPRPFMEDEIALARTAAEKAMLLLEEAALREESGDAAQQQSATAEILRMLTRPASDPQSLFRTIVERARVLCEADNTTLTVFQGERARIVANAGEFPDEAGYVAARASMPAIPDPTTITGRILLTRATVQLPDLDADTTLKRTALHGSGGRSVVASPLLRDGEVSGMLIVRRRTLRPFAARHVRLLETFADQAAIAIENARLFATVTAQSRELARFLSPEIAKLVTTDEGATMLEAHRREITVLFCDLRGFSGFSEVTEPEEVLRVIRQYQATMGRLIVEYRGTLEHFAGDGMMVFFNDPVPLDGHERAAVQLAIAMQSAFREVATTWQARGHDLGLGIGIASGFATLGRIGFEGRYDYGAIGNVVIVASRLSTAAKSGQVLVTQRVQAALDRDTRTESLGNLELKGITRLVPTFIVQVERQS